MVNSITNSGENRFNPGAEQPTPSKRAGEVKPFSLAPETEPSESPTKEIPTSYSMDELMKATYVGEDGVEHSVWKDYMILKENELCSEAQKQQNRLKKIMKEDRPS